MNSGSIDTFQHTTAGSGQHDRPWKHRRVVLLQMREDFHAAHFGKNQVEHDDGVPFSISISIAITIEFLHRLAAIADKIAFETGTGEQNAQKRLQRMIVVDDQYSRGHFLSWTDTRSLCSFALCAR